MPSFEGGRFQRYGAGGLLLEHLLEWCFAQNLEVFDFTIGDEGYKNAYCDLLIPLYTAEIPVTKRGKIWSVVLEAKRRFEGVGSVVKSRERLVSHEADCVSLSLRPKLGQSAVLPLAIKLSNPGLATYAQVGLQAEKLINAVVETWLASAAREAALVH